MEAFLTIADAAKLIAAKQLSPVELTRYLPGPHQQPRSHAA